MKTVGHDLPLVAHPTKGSDHPKTPPFPRDTFHRGPVRHSRPRSPQWSDPESKRGTIYELSPRHPTRLLVRCTPVCGARAPTHSKVTAWSHPHRAGRRRDTKRHEKTHTQSLRYKDWEGETPLFPRGGTGAPSTRPCACPSSFPPRRPSPAATPHHLPPRRSSRPHLPTASRRSRDRKASTSTPHPPPEVHEREIFRPSSRHSNRA